MLFKMYYLIFIVNTDYFILAFGYAIWLSQTEHFAFKLNTKYQLNICYIPKRHSKF